jgi:hypothetical protein
LDFVADVGDSLLAANRAAGLGSTPGGRSMAVAGVTGFSQPLSMSGMSKVRVWSCQFGG